METPSVPVAVWLVAAFDPVLILIAGYLGYKADQAGKIVIAVIAALAGAVIVAYAFSLLGLPWIAPVGGDHPTLLPVRTIGALVWASAGYALGRLQARDRSP
ncbi:hypothetical protein [Salinarimonas sp.]|uniref:hypothetical protein n=1 Tax=Salinarimonas sp. TaxID=2766526 RepID=UPI00391AA894